ncbi:MAG: prephenate dehydrogenase/arogenate dehydrogenase family protein [Vicinamibacterales bacterium]
MRSIAIVGLGLIGTSVSLAAKARWSGVEVTGIDRSDPLEGVRGADVVVLAAPVDGIIGMLPRLARLVGAETLVLDTGSTKRAILAAAAHARILQFVGGHPMAGGTQPGPAGASADLFQGRTWFLMGKDAPSGAIERATAFVEGLGARPHLFSDNGEQHDRIVAAVSHLPQVVASTLMTVVGDAMGPEGLQWAGSGLRDTTRLALSHADMWMGILETNRDQLKPLLKDLAARLDAIADHLDDREAVRLLFEEAVRAKASCL